MCASRKPRIEKSFYLKHLASRDASKRRKHDGESKKKKGNNKIINSRTLLHHLL